jgi:hypothetical protein
MHQLLLVKYLQKIFTKILIKIRVKIYFNPHKNYITQINFRQNKIPYLIPYKIKPDHISH